MTSVGTIVRSARESQGRSLAEIAEDLCITQRYLRAIEADDLKSLPGTFFYKSFVKQYAGLLGIPEKVLKPGIEALTKPYEEAPVLALVPARPPDPRPQPGPVRDVDPLVRASNRYYFSNSRIGVSLAALAGVLLVCSAVYAWWSKPPKAVVATTQVSAVRTSAGVENSQGDPSATTQIVSQSSGSQPIIEVTAADNDPSHVILNLSATEKTWISIESEGKQIFSGMLMPSQTKTLTGRDAAKMKVGNAGGIEVRLNGRAIGPLGGRGEVRTILFTPENFQILEPAPPVTEASPL